MFISCSLILSMLLMGTQAAADQNQLLLQAPCLMRQHDTYKHAKQHDDQDHSIWMIMEAEDHATSSSLEDSSASNRSSTSSSDLVDDASSTNSNNGPLFELSELMAQLPIKRGLSKYYQGKSQSFTSLSRAMSLEDLAKKETPYRKKIKACKSYAGGLDIKATISKKVSRGSFSSLSCSSSRRGSFLGSNNNNNNNNNNNRLPPVPVQKHF